MTATVTPNELAARLQAGGALLIDVRTPAEFEEIHVPLATSVPLDRLDPSRLDKSQKYFVICRSGGRGATACDTLRAAGFDAANIEGGTLAWERAGLPVVRGRKTMALERQVRIAAGGIALTGAVLALAIHPYFAGVPAFIGAGLVFSGVTDTCGMGLVLARMPWNRRGAGCAVPQA